MNFKDLKQARSYFYIWLLESIMRNTENIQNTINNSTDLDFLMVYIYFIN
jgi:hypothetical protein